MWEAACSSSFTGTGSSSSFAIFFKIKIILKLSKKWVLEITANINRNPAWYRKISTF